MQSEILIKICTSFDFTYILSFSSPTSISWWWKLLSKPFNRNKIMNKEEMTPTEYYMRHCKHSIFLISPGSSLSIRIHWGIILNLNIWMMFACARTNNISIDEFPYHILVTLISVFLRILYIRTLWGMCCVHQSMYKGLAVK